MDGGRLCRGVLSEWSLRPFCTLHHHLHMLGLCNHMKTLLFNLYLSLLWFQGHGTQQTIYDFVLNPTMPRTAKATSLATSTTMGIFYSPITAHHFLVLLTTFSWVQQFPNTVFKYPQSCEDYKRRTCMDNSQQKVDFELEKQHGMWYVQGSWFCYISLA